MLKLHIKTQWFVDILLFFQIYNLLKENLKSQIFIKSSNYSFVHPLQAYLNICLCFWCTGICVQNNPPKPKGYERIIRESILRRSGYFSKYILLILMWIIFCCTIFLMSPLFCHNIINIWIAISVRGGQMEVDFWIFWVKKNPIQRSLRLKKQHFFALFLPFHF